MPEELLFEKMERLMRAPRETLFERLSRQTEEALKMAENGGILWTPQPSVLDSNDRELSGTYHIRNDDMTKPQQIPTLPLSVLTLSGLNVRKTEPDAFIQSLADDIAARGLKQNLVVVPNGKAGHYEVVAGGRRFQAMQLLVERGDLNPDHQVAVVIDAKEDAVETSLAENLHRVAMNPADEFLAYRTVIDDMTGTPDERIALCARRFGQTETHVRGRLRLANLAPVVLEGLRTNVIGIGSAMAYAVVDNHDLQKKVWDEHCKPNAWKPHEAQRVRDQMLEKTYAVDDPRVKYIGLKTYHDAGGQSDTDLFSTDLTVRLRDTTLVDSLVKAKFEKDAPKVAKKLGVTGLVLATDNWGSNAKTPAGWVQSNGVTTYRDGEPFDEIADRMANDKPTMVPAMIDRDGKLVRCPNTRSFFRTKQEADEIAAAAPARDPYVPMTEEQRAEAARQRGIRLEAFRLAFPRCVGTPLENRVFIPAFGQWCRFSESDDGQTITIEAEIRVSKAELDAQLEAAAEVYDAAVIAAAEQKERAAADREAQIAAMIGNPPAVIMASGTDYFRWESGIYASIPETEADENDEFEEGTLDDIIAEAGRGPIVTFATMEEYVAQVVDGAEAPEFDEVD